MSWLRVFRSPDAAHLGHGGGQARQTRAVPSENGVARGGSAYDKMGMIPARFTRVLQRYAGYLCMRFLLIFQEVGQVNTTCNQLLLNPHNFANTIGKPVGGILPDFGGKIIIRCGRVHDQSCRGAYLWVHLIIEGTSPGRLCHS